MFWTSVDSSGQLSTYAWGINDMMIWLTNLSQIIFNYKARKTNFLTFEAHAKPLKFELMFTGELIQLTVINNTIAKKETLKIHKIVLKNKPIQFYIERVAMYINKYRKDYPNKD